MGVFCGGVRGVACIRACIGTCDALVIQRFLKRYLKDNTILWISKLCSCVSVSWCFAQID